MEDFALLATAAMVTASLQQASLSQLLWRAYYNVSHITGATLPLPPDWQRRMPWLLLLPKVTG